MTDTNKPEEKTTEAKRSYCRKTGLIIFILLLLLLASGLVYGYLQWKKIDSQLSQLTNEIKDSDHSASLTNLQNTVNIMQESLQKSQNLSGQQEQLLSEWRAAQSGDMNKWHAAQAEYLIHFANNQLQFAHNIPVAIQLLQQAEKELASAQDPLLLEVRKSIASDLVNLQALPTVDVTAIFLKLNALNDLVDKLPLPAKPLEPEPQNTSESNAGWKSFLSGLNKIVIVRKNDASALPLVLPDEKIFLYQNLHAQLESASWALLNENAAIYAASLARADAWIKQYFVQDAAETKSMLQQLSELQKINIQPPAVSLTNTLQSLNAYQTQTRPKA